MLSSLYHSAAAFHSYTRYYAHGETGYMLGCLGSSLLAAFGVWCLMFGGHRGRLSSRTGADKRTSGFPFKNAEADKKRRPKEL